MPCCALRQQNYATPWRRVLVSVECDTEHYVKCFVCLFRACQRLLFKRVYVKHDDALQ